MDTTEIVKIIAELRHYEVRLKNAEDTIQQLRTKADISALKHDKTDTRLLYLETVHLVRKDR
tara:strand:+ start:313 stop:498 length:186 start_codon:yes stop_codon:yes gene_type:complete